MEIKDKIKVFISSQCGIEKYDIVREALKRRLEDTGVIDVYLFEATGAYSSTAMESYLGRLDDCDIILFLIDNEDSICPEGVMKEWKRANDLQKKSLYVFLNDKTKDETTIQKNLYGPTGTKFLVINEMKEFIEKGYISVIEDIFITYKNYCRGRLNNKIEEVENDNIEDNENNIFNQTQSCSIKKDMIKKFTAVKEYFKSKNPYYSANNIVTNSEIEECFLTFANILLHETSYNKKSIELLIKLVSESHLDENRDIILKKWESIKYCYENEISTAIECLSESYECSLDKGIDKWIINDILIDKRNLEYLFNQQNNIIALSEAQKIINNNEDVLYYPVLDRISNNIYNNITKEINNVNMSTPYTTKIGTNIDSILEDISEYYILAIYYGSYTHIKLVVKLLEDVFYNFYKIYGDNRWGFEALKYGILNSDSKVIKDICDRNSKVISACSTDKIRELYNLSDKTSIKYEKYKLKINTFKYLAYYFEENNYIDIEKEIFMIFNELLYSETSSKDLCQLIFESIKSSIHRINKEKVIDVIFLVVHKKYYRFFDDIFEILYRMDLNAVSEDKFNEVVKCIVNILKDKNLNKESRYLKQSIIRLRKCRFEGSNILDQAILNNWIDFYDCYKLEISENQDFYSLAQSYIEEIKSRNLAQVNEFYVGYGYNPQDLIRNIIQSLDIDLRRNDLINSITNVCRDCLINKKQIIGEKISSIQLLLILRHTCEENNIEFDWEKYNDSLNEDDILDGCSDILLNKETKLTLTSNYILYKIKSNNSVDTSEILELLTYYNDNVYENIKLIEAINIFIENSGVNQFKEIHIILMQFISRYIHDDNYEIRYRVIKCLFSFINKVDKDIVINYIDIMSNDADYRVKLSILNNIEQQDNKLLRIYKEILEKYIVDNHYLVRSKSKKLFNIIDIIENDKN